MCLAKPTDGWALFEIWTMWFLDRLLEGPQIFFETPNVKSIFSVSLFSDLFSFGA